MTADISMRLGYVDDAVSVLWPRTRPHGRPDARRVLLPSRRMPRLLVPVRPRRAAAAATVRYTAQQPLPDRLKGLVLAGAVWGGVLSAYPGVPAPHEGCGDGESIDDYLSTVFGTRVVSTLAVTAARANRKPVLQAFDRRGRTLAFVKVGIDPLTRALVEHEADVLETLHARGLTRLRPPAVLHRGRWRAMSVIALAALPRGRRIRGTPVELDRAMREISAIAAAQGDDRLDALRAEAQAGLDRGLPRIAEWLALFDRATDALPLGELSWGAWHGDWTEWNCSMRSGRVAVWDWERFALAAPVGSDRLHFVLNRLVGPRRDRFAPAATTLITDASVLLSPWTVRGAAARATAVTYLLRLCLRYLLDGAPARSVGSQVETWAYPAIRASLVAALRPTGAQ